MNKLRIGLIGYGTVGFGVVEVLLKKRTIFRNQTGVDIVLTKVCDRHLPASKTKGLPKNLFTKNSDDILNDPHIDVVIELIGGKNAAKHIVSEALSHGKHVITANKDLIANHGKELFALAAKNGKKIYFESAVGAGTPIIKTISEGVAGNDFRGLYGIINGTCNFILSEMTLKGLTFEAALKDAQAHGYAESDPTLDINGMDSTHKLAILVFLAFGKFIQVKDIYTEGIEHISHDDIEYAQTLGLDIKLLAIAKKENGHVEARVHPTLIPQDHPMASINGINNAVYLNCDLMGNILLSGEGAGKFAAASGVISDLLNLATAGKDSRLLCDNHKNENNLRISKIDDIQTKFYLRFNAPDKPGVLGKITSILGRHGVSINSVHQKAHVKAAVVPVFMLTEISTEHNIRKALNDIYKKNIVKAKPIAIRMEKLW